MPAETTIQHKRRNSTSFSDGDLAIGEIGIHTGNRLLYFSTDGTNIIPATDSGYSEMFIAAGEMIPRETNGAVAQSFETTANNINYDSFIFESAVRKGVGFWVNFGSIWNAGNVKVKLYWTAIAGTVGQGVAWNVKSRSFSDNDTLDANYGSSGVIISDAYIAAEDIHITDISSDLTITDANQNEPVYFQITREVADVSDTLSEDARLLGISIQYIENLAWQGGIRNLTIPADAFIPNLTGGAALTAREIGTNNINISTYNFDGTASEAVALWFNLGNGWDGGTLKFKAHWTTSGGAAGQTVKWDFAARTYADGDYIIATLGTTQSITDTWIADNDLHISDASPALTVGGTPVAGQPIYLEISRDVATDTLSADAELIAITIEYTNANAEPSGWV